MPSFSTCLWAIQKHDGKVIVYKTVLHRTKKTCFFTLCSSVSLTDTYFENMEIGSVVPYFLFHEKILVLIAGVRLSIFQPS